MKTSTFPDMNQPSVGLIKIYGYPSPAPLPSVDSDSSHISLSYPSLPWHSYLLFLSAFQPSLLLFPNWSHPSPTPTSIRPDRGQGRLALVIAAIPTCRIWWRPAPAARTPSSSPPSPLPPTAGPPQDPCLHALRFVFRSGLFHRFLLKNAFEEFFRAGSTVDLFLGGVCSWI